MYGFVCTSYRFFRQVPVYDSFGKPLNDVRIKRTYAYTADRIYFTSTKLNKVLVASPSTANWNLNRDFGGGSTITVLKRVSALSDSNWTVHIGSGSVRGRFVEYIWNNRVFEFTRTPKLRERNTLRVSVDRRRRVPVCCFEVQRTRLGEFLRFFPSEKYWGESIILYVFCCTDFFDRDEHSLVWQNHERANKTIIPPKRSGVRKQHFRVFSPTRSRTTNTTIFFYRTGFTGYNSHTTVDHTMERTKLFFNGRKIVRNPVA